MTSRPWNQHCATAHPAEPGPPAPGLLPDPGHPVDPALVAFCDAHHLRIVNLIAGTVVDRHVAEDLAQEAFLRLHLRWDRLATPEDARAWVARVGLNLANSWWRRRYAEARANLRHGRRAGHTDGEETADRVAVRSAVAALPRRQRTAVALRYFAGLSVEETAEVMRCRPGTVKSLTHKGMEALRRHFDQERPEPSGAGRDEEHDDARPA